MWQIRFARNNSTGTGTYKTKKEGKVEKRKFRTILKKGKSKERRCNNIGQKKGRDRDRERTINPGKEDQ